MKIKLTNEKKADLFAVLAHIKRSNAEGMKKTNPFFNYAVMRNIDLLEKGALAVRDTNILVLTDYNKERIALAEQHAEKDKDGKAITLDNGRRYDIQPGNAEAFNTAFLQLREKHKEVLDKSKAFMEAEEDVEVFGMKLETFPEIEIDVQDALMSLIAGQPTE